jgi:hypothetical protein
MKKYKNEGLSMKSYYSYIKIIFCTIFAIVLFQQSSQAELLVYDGIPTGSGGYNNADLKSTSGTAQNPTHSSIVGETGAWNANNGSNSGTGAIKTTTTTNLFYPAGVNLTSIGGTVDFTHPETKTDIEQPYRVMGRNISVANETLARKSFFATVLMAYTDLTHYIPGAFAGWGLSRTIPTYTSYPSTDGVLVGFQKSETDVKAVLIAGGTQAVIGENVEPGTYMFAIRFEYSDIGEEIISAALINDSTVPSFANGDWTATVTNEVLNSAQNLGWINLGTYYPIGGKHIYIDEWRVGTEWHDVAGVVEGLSYVVNSGATYGDVTLSGTVTKSGDEDTTVIVYYGREDGADNSSAWEHFHVFSEPATEDDQVFAVAPDNLAASTNYFYRFAVSTPAGDTFAPWTDTFSTFQSVPPELAIPTASAIGKTAATINGTLLAGYPDVAITACLDTADHGSDSLPEDWEKTIVLGEFSAGETLTAVFSGLVANTGYSARFYGASTDGTSTTWSDVVTFSTATPTLSVRDTYVKKGGAGVITPVSVPVTLDVASGQDVSFRYYTSQATEANCENAKPDVHYIDESVNFTVPSGVTQTNITVRIIGNDDVEFPGRRFYIGFDTVEGAANTPGNVEVGTLCDNLGKLIFMDDFSSGLGKWTVSDSSLHISGGRFYFKDGTGKIGRAGNTNMKEYGLRVMSMSGNKSTWQSWGIGVYDLSTSGGGTGYRFTFKDGGGATGYDGALATNGVFAAGYGGVEVMRGSRVGRTPVMRPVSMRVQKTHDDHNRVQCWAGYFKAVDFIDESGDFLEGGQFVLTNNGWNDLWWDDVEVFQDSARASVMVIR